MSHLFRLSTQLLTQRRAVLANLPMLMPHALHLSAHPPVLLIDQSETTRRFHVGRMGAGLHALQRLELALQLLVAGHEVGPRTATIAATAAPAITAFRGAALLKALPH